MASSPTQSRAQRTLAAYLRGGRLPHALIIEGGTAEERATFARLAAQGALCEGEGDRPCGSCRHCVKGAKGIHPDILAFAGGGGARSFHIDAVRAIRQQAYVRPNEADRKTFLLERVEELSVQAQNALLKIIEEPPEGVLFLMTCENKSVLLETILSRSTVLALDRAASGGEDGEAGDRAWDILEALCGQSELDALEKLQAFERDRDGFAALLAELRGLVAELLVRPAGEDRGRKLQKRMSRLQLAEIIAIIDRAASAAAGNGNALLLTTAFCAGVRRAVNDR